MATRMSRVLAGSLRGRLYSTQVARRDVQTSDITEASVNNVRVALVDNGGPISRMTFIVKAGSRYEDGSNLGMSHLIRHLTHMSTKKNSTLKVLKELEISGGTVSTQSTRDYAILSLSCTRDMFQQVFTVCAPAITRARLNDWDLSELDPAERIRTDLGFLQNQPDVELLELLHGAAYNGTLGNSLFMSPRFVDTLSKTQVLKYMNTYYRPERTVVASSNIAPEEVLSNVDLLGFAAATSQAVETKANYLGGENRLPVGGLDSTYVAFATEGPSLSSPQLLSAAVLQNIIGSQQRVKYATSTSKLATAVQKVTDGPFSVNGINANYTDSGLFGFSVSARSDDIEKVLKTAFTTFANLGRSGVSDEDVQRGKNQLKSNIAMKLETEEGFINNLAEQAIGSDKFVSVNEVLQMVDAITTSDVVNAAKKFASGKPTMASLGNLKNVPLLDQLLK